MRIPDGVTDIGNLAFYQNSIVTNITIPNGVSNIGRHAFCGCNRLANVSIPAGVIKIGNNAFDRCSSLTSVTIPDSVTSIGEGAFSDCSSLEKFILSGIPEKVGKGVFGGKSLFGVKRRVGLYLNVWPSEFIKSAKDYIKSIHFDRSITEIPSFYRKFAVRGFVEEPNTYSSRDTIESYQDYISKNAGNLLEESFSDIKLLYYMCENKLIKAKDIEMYIEEATKRRETELIALLLEYQNGISRKEIVKARKKKEKDKEEATVIPKRVKEPPN